MATRKARGPKGSVTQTTTTGLSHKRRNVALLGGEVMPPRPEPIVYPARAPLPLPKMPLAQVKGPSTGIRNARLPEKLIGKRYKYTPINLTVYTAAYSGAISGLVGSSRWLEDGVQGDYAGFAQVAGTFAESFDQAWEASPDTNPPDTLQVFIIEKTSKAVWESRDVGANSSTLDTTRFTQVSEAVIALVLASETYFAAQGITPAPWPGGGGSTISAVDAGQGISVDTVAGTATVSSLVPATTVGSYVQPISSAALFMEFTSTYSMQEGLYAFVNGGGWYAIQSVTDDTHAYLINLGLSENLAPGGTIPSGSEVVVSGDPEAYSTTTVTTSFTQPAVDSAPLTVTFSSTTGMQPNTYIYIVGGGWYSVSAVDDLIHADIVNIGIFSNATPGTTIGSGTFVVTPAGDPNGNILSVEGGAGISVATIAGILTIALAGVRTPWTIENFYVDPSNSTGHASDSNDGLTPSTPILTTAELNMRLFLHDIQVNATVTYLSDDLGYVQFDPSTVSVGLNAPGSLTFQGTPQVLHTGGTINVGTIAINPTAAGGGQRQVVHTSDVTTFLPYVIASEGGTASYPSYVEDSVTGDSAWIVSAAAPASPSMSRPVTQSIDAGAVSIGNGYTIKRGSALSIVSSQTPVGNNITFQDFSFSENSIGFEEAIYIRCAWTAPLQVNGEVIHSFIGASISATNGGLIIITAGVLTVTGNTTDTFPGDMIIQSDTYITGNGSFTVAQDFFENVAITEGTFGNGAQFQDISSISGALEISGNQIFGAENDGLIWGNGNYIGMLIIACGSILVSATIPPTVTGSAGDFGFQTVGPLEPIVFVARAWNEITASYGPQVATTWANFSTTFNYAAFSPQSFAALLGAS